MTVIDELNQKMQERDAATRRAALTKAADGLDFVREEFQDRADPGNDYHLGYIRGLEVAANAVRKAAPL